MSHFFSPRTHRRALLTTLLLALNGSALASASDTGFRYQSSHGTPVVIQLASDGRPALLSFYSDGANGLRLLENVFTDADGTFTGELRLPAHLQQVVMVIRGDERQDTLTLAVQDQTLGYSD
ncbi:MAG: hypothetical protein KA204_04505 [Chromatiaceae bacterium]|jgi:hypothetical protein|nr:hypothetical protein [Chromatiaceae bacterium]MBP6806900.1 hypothetical protein [Chromatiaceae bacterium]MBP8197316.1 hypothetical protein [Chromatiaceae bacterium]MBP8283109.1 hypothetical protein [Chromatiaceae bacterium]